MALGRASETVPSTSITSLFDGLLLANSSPDAALPAVTAHGNQNCTEIAHLCRWWRTADAAAAGLPAHAATAARPSGALTTTRPFALPHTQSPKSAHRLPPAAPPPQP